MSIMVITLVEVVDDITDLNLTPLQLLILRPAYYLGAKIVEGLYFVIVPYMYHALMAIQTMIFI